MLKAPLNYAMLHADALSSEFNAILDTVNIFGTTDNSIVGPAIQLTLGFTGTVAALPENSGTILINSSTDCFIEFGDSSVTTTTSSLYFAAGIETMGIPVGAEYIAVKPIGLSGVVAVFGDDTAPVKRLTTNAFVTAYSTSSSVALPANSGTVRLFAMADLFINFGTSGVVAADTDTAFLAGTEIVTVPGGATHIAAIQDVIDNGLYITGMN
jgi:hypothetical protein